MKINKIVLYNFNSYEGLNEFDFTCENNSKNIILIGGKNGAGKTSLFTAIKIALYGPLSFGYVGVNPKYIAKIKDCINSRAFQKDVVRSKVQISVSLTVEREIKEYEITREWDYTKQKLDEKYYVKTEDRFLDGQELSYFQNYLQSMIPPDLFEFFLFDGEEVGSIFSTSTYNSYVKNAVYTLCGLDVFEIIRKYTTGYAGKASSKDEEKIYSHYKELRKNADEIDISFADLEAQIASDKNELEKVETELIEIETAFKNAGGITEVERQALMKEFTEAEHTKTESLTKIKMFVEGLMPFIILRDFTGRITEQLDFEEKGEIYYYVQQKLKRQEIKKALNEKQEVSEDTVEALMDFLLKKFKPKGFKEGAQSVHDLSKEDLGRVNAMISAVEDFDTDSMIELVKKRKSAADRTMEINRILKSAMTDEDAGKFAKKENILLKKKDEISYRIHESEMRLTAMKEELAFAVQQRDRAFQAIKDSVQNKNVFKLSTGLSHIMGEILDNKTKSIKRSLERLIVENLQHIYRKNNLITHIEIEDDYQFNLWMKELRDLATQKYNEDIHKIIYDKPTKFNKTVTKRSGQFLPKHIFAVRQYILPTADKRELYVPNEGRLKEYLEDRKISAEHFFVNQSENYEFHYGEGEIATIKCPAKVKKFISYPINYLYLDKHENSALGDGTIVEKIEELDKKEKTIFANELVYQYYKIAKEIFTNGKYPRNLNEIKSKMAAKRAVKEYYTNDFLLELKRYIEEVSKLELKYFKESNPPEWRVKD